MLPRLVERPKNEGRFVRIFGAMAISYLSLLELSLAWVPIGVNLFRPYTDCGAGTSCWLRIHIARTTALRSPAVILLNGWAEQVIYYHCTSKTALLAVPVVGGF